MVELGLGPRARAPKRLPRFRVGRILGARSPTDEPNSWARLTTGGLRPEAVASGNNTTDSGAAPVHRNPGQVPELAARHLRVGVVEPVVAHCAPLVVVVDLAETQIARMAQELGQSHPEPPTERVRSPPLAYSSLPPSLTHFSLSSASQAGRGARRLARTPTDGPDQAPSRNHRPFAHAKPLRGRSAATGEQENAPCGRPCPPALHNARTTPFVAQPLPQANADATGEAPQAPPPAAHHRRPPPRDQPPQAAKRLCGPRPPPEPTPARTPRPHPSGNEAQGTPPNSSPCDAQGRPRDAITHSHPHSH